MVLLRVGPFYLLDVVFWNPTSRGLHYSAFFGPTFPGARSCADLGTGSMSTDALNARNEDSTKVMGAGGHRKQKFAGCGRDGQYQMSNRKEVVFVLASTQTNSASLRRRSKLLSLSSVQERCSQALEMFW